MKTPVCLVVLLLLITNAKAQKDLSIKKYTDSLSTAYAKGNYCGNNERRTPKKLNKSWSFDSVKEIRLVSYKVGNVITKSSDFADTLESVTVKGDVRDQLVDVLFNYKIESTEEKVHFCWSPRNAVLFLNGKNELIGQINLCFECSSSFERSVPIFLGIECPEKWNLLKLIFGAAGIKHGISKLIIDEESDKRIEFDPDKAYTFVDLSAEPVGGLEKFYQWIDTHLKYPNNGIKRQRQAKVFVKFIIEKDGTITNVEVVKGINDECDQEAVRVISSSPKWLPGINGGKSVRQSYTLPINFRL